MNREDKIFQVYLYLLQAKPDWPATRAAHEAVDLLECLEKVISEKERIEDIRRMIDEKRAVWDILDLTVRTAHCLRAEEIYTLDDLCRSSERRILSIPNLGKKSFHEIREALAKIGRTIGEKR